MFITNNSILSLIGKKNFIRIFVFFIFVFTGLSFLFIKIQAFETLHTFSRLHEDWELDELILVFFSLLITISLSTLIVFWFLIQKLRENTRKQIQIEAQLAQSRKMEAMGNLLGGISHSMNNHLQPILMLTKMVKNELPKTSELAADLEKVITATKSAKKILRNILNFTHQQETHFNEVCNISEAIKLAVELASTAIPSAIKLKVIIPTLNECVSMSKLNLEIIIINLINNAIDAIGEKTGTIELSLLSLGKLSPLNTPSVCIKVKDDGCGLTDEQKNRIFDPFFTTKDVGKGTGLGLSESYGIIAAASGKIEVDNQIGCFTEFKIYLPICTKASQ